MVVTIENHGNYHRLTGTISEVFTELTERSVRANEVVYMESDGTVAIYSKTYS